MKNIFLLLIILLSLVVTGCDDTFTPLDKIHEYKITVNPNDDGTLKMKYYLKWEVLEEGDGGVDFITVGVANRFVYDIKGLSGNIKDIDYSSEDGSTIRIDFKNIYHKGDIFEVEFSFTQKRIFSIKGDEVQYSFEPGWFEEIQVDKLTVYWNNSNVLKNNATGSESDYLKWETALDYGETIKVNLVYSKDHFPKLNPKEDYSSQTVNPIFIIIFFSSIIAFVIIVAVISRLTADKYQTCRGFSGHIHHHHFYFGRHHGYRKSGKVITPPNSGGHGVHGNGCACACACACAGGGRAGCSRKDFNNYLNV